MAAETPNRSALEALIRRLRLHSALSEADAEAIRSLPFIVATHSQRSQLVREGERTTQCAVLVSGFVQRFRITELGARQILAVYVPGDPIDFDHLFLPVADDYLQVVRDCTLAYIRQDDLRDLLAKRTGVFEAIVRALLVDASIFREWTVNVGRRDARGKIAHLVCEVSARLEAQGYNVGKLPMPLTQDQIADATGLTPIHVNRTLKALSAENLIERRNGDVILPRPDGLRELAGFDELYLHIRPEAKVRRRNGATG